VLRPGGVALWLYEPTSPAMLRRLVERRANRKGMAVPEHVFDARAVLRTARAGVRGRGGVLAEHDAPLADRDRLLQSPAGRPVAAVVAAVHLQLRVPEACGLERRGIPRSGAASVTWR
jgi:hypothetical protein